MARYIDADKLLKELEDFFDDGDGIAIGEYWSSKVVRAIIKSMEVTNMICDKCGGTFEFGNHPDGIPNGIKLEFDSGDYLTLCSECIMHIDDQEGQEWLTNWRDEHEHK